MTCNGTMINSIDIQNNQLVGSIPKEIGNLTNLNELWLDFNQLSGTLPTEIGNLTKLERLALYNNKISGKIPTELGNLTNLKHLILNDNVLVGNIPTELRNLTTLTECGLLDNKSLWFPHAFNNSSICKIQNGIIPSEYQCEKYYTDSQNGKPLDWGKYSSTTGSCTNWCKPPDSIPMCKPDLCKNFTQSSELKKSPCCYIPETKSGGGKRAQCVSSYTDSTNCTDDRCWCFFTDSYT